MTPWPYVSVMEAQLQSAHCQFRNELEETKAPIEYHMRSHNPTWAYAQAIWRAELAAQQREQEACTEGWAGDHGEVKVEC